MIPPFAFSRPITGLLYQSVALGLALIASSVRLNASEQPPNFIVIFCDDLGYGDTGCYGSEKNRTPKIDRMASEGMRFTSFYSSSPVCTPSRASLMTGCYAQRVGMHMDYTGHWVLIPGSRRGLHPSEITLAESLRTVGYTTACIGKWHLGDQPPHLPTRHGFDHYFGIPYSNDMAWEGRGDPPLPLMRDEDVVDAPVDQATLTGRYTEEAIRFITENARQPFFLYLPHTFPHLPLHASEAFRDRSANGRYGDCVEEIDWSTGKILDALDELQLSEKTLVIFTSDNGSNGRNGGSNHPLAGAKGSTMEGGMRVPMIARWTGTIEPGTTCHRITATMDIFPTFAALAEAPLPVRPIDGHDIRPLLLEDPSGPSPWDEFLYFRRRQLQAIRVGDWKYHLPMEQSFPNWTTPEKTGPGREGRLVNLASDLSESTDLSRDYPEVVRMMEALADKAKATLGHENREGSQQRPALTLESASYQTLRN